MSGVFQGIACRIGRHDLFIVRPVSDQAAQVECNHCRKQWAMKLEGDNVGAMIPWVEAQFFYTDERIMRVLNSGSTHSAAPCREGR